MRRLILAVFALCAGVVFAQDYPSRPITLIVPFPPGGVADNVARPVAQALTKQLGQTVIIENKQGAGGGIGMAYVAKAKPDGYTLLLALSSISVIPEADKVLGRAPMFQLDQLLPIARFTADPVVLAVRAESPWKTYAEFIAYAKANPKKLNYGSSGNYGTMHVPMEMLGSSAGASFTHVPFTGAAPAVTALLGGTLDAVASGPSTVVQHVKAGKLRVLANGARNGIPRCRTCRPCASWAWPPNTRSGPASSRPQARRKPCSMCCARPHAKFNRTRCSCRRSLRCKRHLRILMLRRFAFIGTLMPGRWPMSCSALARSSNSRENVLDAYHGTRSTQDYRFAFIRRRSST